MKDAFDICRTPHFDNLTVLIGLTHQAVPASIFFSSYVLSATGQYIHWRAVSATDILHVYCSSFYAYNSTLSTNLSSHNCHRASGELEDIPIKIALFEPCPIRISKSDHICIRYVPCINKFNMHLASEQHKCARRQASTSFRVTRNTLNEQSAWADLNILFAENANLGQFCKLDFLWFCLHDQRCLPLKILLQDKFSWPSRKQESKWRCWKCMPRQGSHFIVKVKSTYTNTAASAIKYKLEPPRAPWSAPAELCCSVQTRERLPIQVHKLSTVPQ